MSVKINGKEVSGFKGYLIAMPVLVVTFLLIALNFLAVSMLLLSPFILIGLLIWMAAQ